MARHPQEPIRSVSCASTEAAAAWERLWVAWAILRARVAFGADPLEPHRGSEAEEGGLRRVGDPVHGPELSRRPGTKVERREHHQRSSRPQGVLLRGQAGEAGVGPGHEPRLLGGRIQHTPPGGQAEASAFGLPALGGGFLGQREQPLRVEVSDLDRSTHRVGFDHVYSQPDAADNPVQNRC